MRHTYSGGCVALVLSLSACISSPEAGSVSSASSMTTAMVSECEAKYVQEIQELPRVVPDTNELVDANPAVDGNNAYWRGKFLTPTEIEQKYDIPIVEGMTGPYSPRAMAVRDQARSKNEQVKRDRRFIELNKEICLSLVPVAPSDGVCPDGYTMAFDAPMEGMCHRSFMSRFSSRSPMGTKAVNNNAPFRSIRASFTPSIRTDAIYEDVLFRPIRVAFNGGTDSIREEIQAIAQVWAQRVNDWRGYPEREENSLADVTVFDSVFQPLKFDFGSDTPDGFEFNTWSYKDTEFSADIRIGFDNSGYWSMVGTDGTQSPLARPGSASMNLQGFDRYQVLPPSLKAKVFHEFGHALGLLHEHQHPMSECGRALRLEDDEGYRLVLDDLGQAIPDADGRRPGVVTLLQHAPNYWSREEAEFNLAQLKRSRKIDSIDYDPMSVMKYEFASDWYKGDAPVECLPNGFANTEPSELDIALVAQTYRKMLLTNLNSLVAEP